MHLPWCFDAGTLSKYQYSSISIAPALRHWCWYSLRVSQLKYFYCTSHGALVLVLSVSTTTQVFLLHLPTGLGAGTICEYHYSSISIARALCFSFSAQALANTQYYAVVLYVPPCEYHYSSISVSPAQRAWYWGSQLVPQLKYSYCTCPEALVLELCEYHYSSSTFAAVLHPTKYHVCTCPPRS